MADYKKILLVVDLSDDSRIIGERARAIASAFNSEITLLHVVEYVPVEPMGEALLPTVQIESELVERARSRLAELAQKLSFPQCRQLVETGVSRPKSSVLHRSWAATSSCSAAANGTASQYCSTSRKIPCCMPRPATFSRSGCIDRNRLVT